MNCVRENSGMLLLRNKVHIKLETYYYYILCAIIKLKLICIKFQLFKRHGI